MGVRCVCVCLASLAQMLGCLDKGRKEKKTVGLRKVSRPTTYLPSNSVPVVACSLSLRCTALPGKLESLEPPKAPPLAFQGPLCVSLPPKTAAPPAGNQLSRHPDTTRSLAVRAWGAPLLLRSEGTG